MATFGILLNIQNTRDPIRCFNKQRISVDAGFFHFKSKYLSSDSFASELFSRYFASMKARLLVLFIFLTSLACAQKVEEYYDYNWKRCEPEQARYYALIEKTDSGWHRRDFFIHEGSLQMDGYYADSSCKVRQGQFYYFHPNLKLESAGEYVKDRHEGVWVRYYDNGMMHDSSFYINDNLTGYYFAWHKNGYISDSAFYNENGSGYSITWFDNGNPSSAGRFSAGYKMHGKWQFFHRNGRLSAVEIYNEGKLLSKEYYDETGNLETDTTSKDSEATFPGGMQAWKKYMIRHLWFPDQYKIDNADKAVVVVDASIDEEGNVTDVELYAPLHPAFDRIAIEMMQHAPKWIPAVQHNRKVKYRIRQAVIFEQ